MGIESITDVFWFIEALRGSNASLWNLGANMHYRTDANFVYVQCTHTLFIDVFQRLCDKNVYVKSCLYFGSKTFCLLMSIKCLLIQLLMATRGSLSCWKGGGTGGGQEESGKLVVRGGEGRNY